MSTPARQSRIALIVLLAAVGLVVVVAVVVVLLRGAPAQFAADTPQGVVQRYVQAVIDDDTATAESLLAPAPQCDAIPRDTGDYRVTLLETSEHGDTARVRVLVTTTYDSGPFGSGQYQSEESFGLVESGGDWRIETTPWQFTVCAGTAR